MSVQKQVQRQIGVALWRQIADRIRDAINSGEYDATGMVPPETIMASQFGVNRHTVRSALAALAQEGIVRSVQGRGTMIERKERLIYPISRRTRFSQGLGNQVKSIDSQLLSQGSVAANETVARALKVALGSGCIELNTVSSGDGRPLSMATSYFPQTRFPRMGEEFEKLGSITKALAAHGLGDYIRASTRIVARHADADELAALRLSPGAIVLEAQSVNVDLEGTPIEYSLTRFSADRVQFTIDN